jgi:hypothetical protein
VNKLIVCAYKGVTFHFERTPAHAVLKCKPPARARADAAYYCYFEPTSCIQRGENSPLGKVLFVEQLWPEKTRVKLFTSLFQPSGMFLAWVENQSRSVK